MNMIRWSPFGEFERSFDRLLPRRFATWAGVPSGNGGVSAPEWSPSADISETELEYLIRAELPAVKNEDLKVTVDDGMIRIAGERKQRSEDKTEKYHRIETFSGSFERSFSLPDSVKVDAIRCENKDGVLTVHLPKKQTEKAKPKQVTVE